MKIMVIGYCGSGKSTLARSLGKKYHLPVLHLDHVFWLPGWQSRPREEMQRIVARFLDSNTSWVIDGNYFKTEYTRRLTEADQVIFLNFNRFSCLARVWKRYRKYRGRTRADMGRGCTEKLDWEFVRWVFFDGRTRKNKAAYRTAQRLYGDKLTVIPNQKQLDQYLSLIELSENTHSRPPGTPAPASGSWPWRRGRRQSTRHG